MSNQKKIKFDYGWGNPYFLLDVLGEMYSEGSFTTKIRSMIYGPYEGTPSLIKATHEVIRQTTGQKYDHVLITHGASSAINMILRSFKVRGGKEVYTTQYGYPSYEEMIQRAGLVRKRGLNLAPVNIGANSNLVMSLIDSPENPIGDQFEGGNPASDVWDGVYNSKIYTKYPNKQPKHKYFVGSYSKLLGVAGARIGFIATNDPLAYESLLHQSHNELTGISIPSQDLIVDILKWVDLEEFMSNSSRYLCYNKEEFQKIEYLFDGQSINETGMFYSPKADAKAIALLDKVGVNFVRLDDETIRLSMGQHKDIVKKGINAILKGDRK